jgi:hypothetical protein
MQLARIDPQRCQQRRRALLVWCVTAGSVSARPTLPSAAVATSDSAGSSASISVAAAARESVVDGQRPRRRLRQRDKMVGSTRDGAWLTSGNSDCCGGSSRIFKERVRRVRIDSSTVSTMQTRQPSTAAVEPRAKSSLASRRR